MSDIQLLRTITFKSAGLHFVRYDRPCALALVIDGFEVKRSMCPAGQGAAFDIMWPTSMEVRVFTDVEGGTLIHYRVGKGEP